MLKIPRRVIPFIGIRAWKDQQKGTLDEKMEQTSLSLTHTHTNTYTLSYVRLPLALDKTDPHSIGGKRVFECIIEAYRALIRKTRGWHEDELRVSIWGHALSYSLGGEWAKRKEGEKRERRRRRRKERERVGGRRQMAGVKRRNENSSSSNHD